MITHAIYYEVVCVRCGNAQVDPENERTLDTSALRALLLAIGMGWQMADESGDGAVCPTCTNAQQLCLDVYAESGELVYGHRFGEPYKSMEGRTIRECARCGAFDDPDAPVQNEAGLVAVHSWHGECDDCHDAYGPWEVPHYPSLAVAVRALRADEWTVKVRKGRPVLTRCQRCTANRLCARDGHAFGEWEPDWFGRGEQARYCQRECSVPGAIEYSPRRSVGTVTVPGPRGEETVLTWSDELAGDLVTAVGGDQ